MYKPDVLQGKGLYLWHPEKVASPAVVASEIYNSGAAHVCLKIADGSIVNTYNRPYVDALRALGIRVGGWQYVYHFSAAHAIAEAKAAKTAIDLFDVDYFLIDAEAHAKTKYTEASIYAKTLRGLVGTDLPIALNSYWKPSYHPSLPFKQYRAYCDFDAPQVYWRGTDPVGKLKTSRQEYGDMSPKLPFDCPGGDMYLEHNLKPTTAKVEVFLLTCDLSVQGAVMWVYDNKYRVPELWSAFCNYKWDGAATPLLPLQVEPLYKAFINATAGLNVRTGPSTSYPKIKALAYKIVVQVWEERYGWVKISQDKEEWVCGTYLTKL
jgi:hypothetical protein